MFSGVRRRLTVLVAIAAAAAAASVGSSEEISVCVSQPYVEAVSALESELPDLHVVGFTAANLLENVPQCRAIVGLYGQRMDDLLRVASRLDWIQSSSAGVESFLRSDELTESSITLTNTRIIQGPEIADHAMGLLLNLTRDLKFYNQQMKTGFERATHLPMIELRGKTALIIGLGGIGTQIAQRAVAFGMRVLAVDPKDFPFTSAVERVGKPDDLDSMLPQADVVFSSVPLTPKSKGMLGKEQFALMKDGVYLINVSRGGIVDTEALPEALRSGKVRAAGLDVTDPEPLPSDHPLWSMDNVTITPHIATLSDELEARRRALFVENVGRYIRGQPLRNVVDKREGY